MKYALPLILWTALLTAVDEVPAQTRPSSPPTRLYVKSDPSGAEVAVDGKPVGQSDGLFELTPGDHSVRIFLPGRRLIERQTHLPAGQITRLEFTLEMLFATTRVTPATSPSPDAPSDTAAIDAASGFVSASDVSDATKHAMLIVIRQHPDRSRWSGQIDDTLFGLAIKKLPANPEHPAIPALVHLAQALAFNELLTAKSILDLYRAADLTDATTLRQAVEGTADGLRVTGSTAGAKQQAGPFGGYAVAFILAQDSALRAELSQPPQVEAVRQAYREVMHAEARQLMARQNWADALLLWQHLHQRRLVSQALYLDAATCFVQLHEPNDAIKILSESLDAFRVEGSEEFFEGAGNLAMKLSSPAAQAVAVRAYELASQRLRVMTVGQGSLPATAVPTH